MKTYHFCTLFDSLYLSRALAMHDSLLNNCDNFHLYAFAFDDRSADILDALALPHVTVIRLKDFEDPALLSVKPSRSKGEYCWTCTPSTVAYCINRFNLDHCTYIDADLYFFADPGVLVDEMGDASVLITEHRYTRKYDQSATSGIYCVQFITFKNTPDGLRALTWWRDRCIEWCYARIEDGKFGDQKYLDDWTTRFSGVHVLQHLGGGVAPWNIQQYTVTEKAGKISLITPKGEAELIFYHFHYVKFYGNDRIDLGNYRLDKATMTIIYRTYLFKIFEVEEMLLTRFQMTPQRQSYYYKYPLLIPLHRIARVLMGIYNIYTKKEIEQWQS